MKIDDQVQMNRILQNLNMLEVSYLDYYRGPLNFQDYRTYLKFFENNIIRSRSLSQLYFTIAEKSEVSDKVNTKLETDSNDTYSILAGYDYSVHKIFNFPSSIPHSCNYYTGIYILEGSGGLNISGQEFSMKKGDFYLIPPHIIYQAHTNPESIGIYFDFRRSFLAAEYKNIFHEHPLISQFITESLKAEHSMTYLALHSESSEFQRQMILSIFMEYLNQSAYSKQAMKNYLSLFFIEILRNENTKMDSSVSMNRMTHQYHLIEEYLQKNYQTASLSGISEEMHFSKQYICRIVKEKTGVTFNDLVMNIRLCKAASFLTETDLTLEAIAELCGFSAASHFSRVFKNKYAVTPSVYRKEYIK